MQADSSEQGVGSSRGEDAEAGYAGSEEGDTPRGGAGPEADIKHMRSRLSFKRGRSVLGSEVPCEGGLPAKVARTEAVLDAPSKAAQVRQFCLK